MKKTIFILTLTTAFLGTGLTSCSSSGEKVEDAQENLNQAEEDLEEANEEYAEDLRAYRVEISERIAANEIRIAELRVLSAAEKGESKLKLEIEITNLEQRNLELKTKMNNYKGDNMKDWNEFKKEFNHDMDELGEALKGLGKSDTK